MPQASPQRGYGPWLLAVLVAPCFVASFAMSQPFPDGPELVVDVDAEGGRVDADSAGNFVVVWRSAGRGAYNVLGQRYDATGSPVGGEFQANLSPTGTGYWDRGPSVAAHDEGFVVVWSTLDATVRQFDAEGVPEGPPFTVTTFNDGEYFPAVACRAGGEFVVGWIEGYLPDYPGYVKVRSFDRSAIPQQTQFQVGHGFYYYAAPDIDMDAAGVFAVVWSPCCDDTVRVRRYELGGSELGSETTVNPGQFFASQPVVSVNEGGDFVVAWRGNDQQGQPLFGFLQRFDAIGSPLGARIDVAEIPVSFDVSFRPIDVAQDSAGEFVVVRYGRTGTEWRVLGRTYATDGTPSSTDFQINTTPLDGIPPASVAVESDPSGNFMAVWQAGETVYSRRYCGRLRVGDPLPTLSCVGDAVVLDVTATGRGPLDYRWRRDGLDLFDGGNLSGSDGPALVLDPVTPADAGSYDVRVQDACATQSAHLSGSATLGVVAAVEEIGGLTVNRSADGASLVLNWSDDPNAQSYVLAEDTEPDGSFSDVTGTSTSGGTGIVEPLPAGSRYYLVAGENTACGRGP